MNMRRILKKPTLRMEDGGQMGTLQRATDTYKSMQPVDPAAANAAKMAMPAAAMTQGQVNHDRSMAAAASTQTFQPMFSSLAAPEQMRITPLQLRDGGGPVPGTGTGDKIPALYEPGEFVVSNDMLDAQPELRSHLKNLRGEVLASQGKSVAEADAEALDYDGGPQGEQHGRAQARNGKNESGRLGLLPPSQVGDQGSRSLRGDLQRSETDGRGRVTLRALDGFEVNERPWTSADSRAFAKQPGPGNPNVGPAGSAEAAALRAPPVATPASGVSLEPTASGLLRDKAFGSSADWAKTANTLTKERSIPGSGMLGKVASKLAAPLAIGSGGYSAYQGASEGDAGKAALGVGDAVAGAALLTPAAPAAAGYLAARGAYEAPQMLRDAIGPRGLETIGGTINQIGRKTGLWGADDSAYLSSKGAMTPPTTLRASAQPQEVRTQTTAAPASQPQASQSLRADPYGRQYQDAAVSNTDHANSDELIRNAFNYAPKTGETSNELRSLRAPGALQKANAGFAMRGSGIQASYDERGQLRLSNSTAPEKMQFVGTDGKPTANYRDTQQYADGIYFAKKQSDMADKMQADNRANAEAASAPQRGEFGFKQYQANKIAQEQNKTQLRGQDIASADGRYGHELTSEVSRNRLRYDMNKDTRDFLTGRADKGFEQQQAADKAWTEHTATTFRTKDDKGNDVPDAQKAAAYTTAVDNTIGQLIPQFAKSPDPKMRAYAEDLTKRGRAALDKEDLANLQVMFERQQVHARTAGGINPLRSSGAVSQNLLDYKVTGKDNSWFQNRSKTAGGQTIPDVNLRYGADANYVMPNFGAGSTYLTPNKLRGE